MSQSGPGRPNSGSSAFGKEASVYPCRDCGKEYDSHQGLRYHYETDHNDCTGYECPECGDNHFISPFGVSRHYGKTHEGHYSEYPRLANEGWFRTKYIEEGHNTREIAEMVGCSRAVATAWKNRHGIETISNYKSRGKGEDNPNWEDNKIKTVCEYCEEDMIIRPRRKQVSEYNFCSRECSHQWKRENWVGENNPLYKGGTLVYNSGWSKVRDDVRERDNYVCQACGKHESQNDRELDVHHIRPAREFDNIGEAHDPDNLVTLCRSCHQKWEGIPVKPVVYDE